MKEYQVINELNKLKTGQPTNDVATRDEALEIAKYAVREFYARKEGTTDV